jgi:hypothetical protein
MAKPKPEDGIAADSGEEQDAWLAELLSRPGPPDLEQLAALQAELAVPSERTPARSVRWLWLLLLPMTGLSVVAARAWLTARPVWRMDLGAAFERVSFGVAALVVCAMLALGAVLHRGRSGFGLTSTRLAVVSGLLTALVTLMPLALRGAEPQPVLHALGAPCAAIVLGSGALGLAIVMRLFRHTQPVGAQARASALGAAIAAWTAIVISLHCPAETMQHLLWGHSAPLLGLVALAAWLLPRQLRP